MGLVKFRGLMKRADGIAMPSTSPPATGTGGIAVPKPAPAPSGGWAQFPKGVDEDIRGINDPNKLTDLLLEEAGQA